MRFPGDIDDLLWNLGPVLFHPLPDFRGRPVIPCCLAKDAAGGRVTGFGYASGSDTAAARMLARRQPEIGDELARVAEPGEIADLGDDRCSDDTTRAAA